MPARKGVGFLPPPRNVPLAPPEDWIRDYGHRCGVGATHREGTPVYRQCQCGQGYAWTGESWDRVRRPGMRDRRDTAGLVDDLFGLGDDTPGRGWRMPTAWDVVMAWRRLRLFLRSLRDR